MVPAIFVPAVFPRLPALLIVVLAALPPRLALAQAAAPPDIGGGFLQLLLGLGAVIALLFASLWLLKRLAAPRGEAAGMMRVVSGIAVGARERVVVVEIAGNWLVLGVAPGRVTALAEMPRAQVAPPPAGAASPPEPRDFAGRVRQMLDRRHAR